MKIFEEEDAERLWYIVDRPNRARRGDLGLFYNSDALIYASRGVSLFRACWFCGSTTWPNRAVVIRHDYLNRGKVMWGSKCHVWNSIVFIPNWYEKPDGLTPPSVLDKGSVCLRPFNAF